MRPQLRYLSGAIAVLFVFSSCLPARDIEVEPTLQVIPVSPSLPAVPVTGPTPTASVIQHKVVPKELPRQRSNHTGDYDSSATAADRRAPAGDRFLLGQFERPFNADTMAVYYPDIDIQEVTVYQDNIWGFAAIRVKGRGTNGAFPGNYGLELDLDLDGSGDFFILAHQPSTSEWTSIGVQIWRDKDNDIGGILPLKTDSKGAGDGYETLVFDQGHGYNADLGWVRISPAEPDTIQIAFLKLLLTGDRAYLTGMWAGYDDLDPALFDFNDHFSQEQAGEAMAELNRYYPIKEVSGLDNTCRMAIGFEPSGSEPGLC